jgi:hypothetical protein
MPTAGARGGDGEPVAAADEQRQVGRSPVEELFRLPNVCLAPLREQDLGESDLLLAVHATAIGSGNGDRLTKARLRLGEPATQLVVLGEENEGQDTFVLGMVPRAQVLLEEPGASFLAEVVT